MCLDRLPIDYISVLTTSTPSQFAAAWRTAQGKSGEGDNA